MLCWQAVGDGLPHGGNSDWEEWAAVRRILRGWTRVGRVSDLGAYIRDGRVACALVDDQTAQLHVGARSRRDLQALVRELGIAIDEE